METHGTTREESMTMNAIREMAKSVDRIADVMEKHFQKETETVGSKARQSDEALADFVLSLKPGVDNITQAYSVIKGVSPDDCLELSSRQMLFEILKTEDVKT